MNWRKLRGDSVLSCLNAVPGWAMCVAGMLLVGVEGAFAAAPSDPRWVALGSREPGDVEVQVLESCVTGLTVGVTLPGFTLGVHDDANGRFVTLALQGCGFPPEPGRPALPVIRRLVVVPADAMVSCTATGTLGAISLSALGVPAQVMPVQSPILKIPGAVEAAGFAKNAAVYASAATYPDVPAQLSEAGTLFGYRLLALEISPFVVVPATGSLAVYSNITVQVTFSKALSLLAEQGGMADIQARQLLAGVALNAPAQGEGMATVQKRLLLIAPESFTNQLAPYISHKTGRGWGVDCFGTNSAGTANTAIQTFIRNRYANTATRPDALLLVGDVGQVPCFVGVSADAPDTDLYYGCMDGEGDWFPEFPVGRFSVSTTNQLAAVIEKTLAYERAPLEPWIKRATFMASEDNYTVSEGTHNAVISSTMAPLGYSSEKLYCYSSNAVAAQVRKAFNRGCALGIYSGHGDTRYWADGPFFGKSDVNALTNAAHYPIICSFACLTGQYSLNECFAETWLRAASKGASAVLASSVTSYWGEDDTLERSFMAAIFQENQAQVGMAVWRAKQLYLANYGVSTSTTRRYFEQYNLLGDPTLELAGVPVLTNGIPVAWFTSQGITNTNYNLELEEDRDGDGMTAYQEYLAGTHPGDALSALRLIEGVSSNGALTLRWLSANTLSAPVSPYQISVCTNLLSGVWLVQTNQILRTPPVNEVKVAIPKDTVQVFYRVTLPD